MNGDRRPRGFFGGTLPPARTDNYLGEILKALTDPPPPAPAPLHSCGIGALFGTQAPPPQPNILGSVFGRPPTVAIPVPVAPQVRRKIFFSFYFGDDIRRSCIVRNSYRFRPGPKLPTANFYDRSLWESSKRESDESLKRLIREGMEGSSVTCVLAGTNTWQRPWVRYEIARSLVCGNGLFTVHIHNVNDPRSGIAAPGPDPLAFMGLALRADGRGDICEWAGDGWYRFDRLKAPVRWPRWLMKPDVGYVRPLAEGTRAYDYNFDDGYNHLAQWAQLAAHEGRRR